MGRLASFMRSMASSTTRLAPSLGDGAVMSSYVSIDIGALLVGGRPWHVAQLLERTSATSHGRPVIPAPTSGARGSTLAPRGEPADIPGSAGVPVEQPATAAIRQRRRNDMPSRLHERDPCAPPCALSFEKRTADRTLR